MDATAEADEAQTAARVEMPPNDRADYDHLVDAVMRLRGWARIGPKRPPRCVICAD